jgi:hypothetical protein
MSWRGRHIQVDTNAAGKPVTSWWCCCRCEKELYDGRDIADGLHYRCRRQVSEWEAERLRVRARAADRRQWRLDHPGK